MKRMFKQFCGFAYKIQSEQHLRIEQTNIIIENTTIAVSYTHLDVYKRQKIRSWRNETK